MTDPARPGAIGFDFAHVYNPQLQAGRGEQFSASRQRAQLDAAIAEAYESGNDFHLPMGRTDDALDTEGLQQATLDAAIPESNRGFQMLQRMGWSAGKGLGRSEDGIVEPVRGGMEAGLRLGVGKAEQEEFYMSAENVTRKRLETEVQADEDYERTLKREMAVERDAQIKQDVSEAMRVLYCDTCRKQYKTAMEMEVHLSSYDHHHAKRLQEMRAATAERTRGERERKERRRQEKEWAKLNAQAARAQQSQTGVPAAPSGAPPTPPPDDDPPPPPPDDSAAAAPLPPPPSDAPHTDAVASGWQSISAAAAAPGHGSNGGWQPRSSASAFAASSSLPEDGSRAGSRRQSGGAPPAAPAVSSAAAGSLVPKTSGGGSGSSGGLKLSGGLAFGAAIPNAKRHAGLGRGFGVGRAAGRFGAAGRGSLKPAVAGFMLDSDDEDGS